MAKTVATILSYGMGVESSASAALFMRSYSSLGEIPTEGARLALEQHRADHGC